MDNDWLKENFKALFQKASTLTQNGHLPVQKYEAMLDAVGTEIQDQLTKMKNIRKNRERVENTGSNQSKCQNVDSEDQGRESQWFPSLSDTSLFSEEEQDEDQLTKMKNIGIIGERVENTGSNQSKCQKVGNDDPSTESRWFSHSLSDTSLSSEEDRDEDQLTKNEKH